MTDKDKLSKTVLGDAWENDIEITDNVKALARAAQIRKEQGLLYKAKKAISDNVAVFVIAVLTFIGTTAAGLITTLLK